MTRTYILFVAFFILLLLTIPFDIATSVVPGWHTTVFSPYFVWKFIVAIVLVLVIIGYWLLFSRVDRINWVLFTIHIGLTIPAIVYPMISSIVLDEKLINHKGLIKAIEFQMKLIPVIWIFFIIGQILFLIYAIRTIKAGRAPEIIP